ncbi:hypothetical protein Tco_1117225 [Tanacetum coccineum]
MDGQAINNLIFRSFIKKEKHSGPNFIDWYRNLRIVFTTKEKLTYLERPILAAPILGQQIPPYALAAHTHWVKASKEIICLMLVSMTPELQKNLEHFYDGFVQNYNMHDMGKTVNELRAMLKLHEHSLPKKDATPAMMAIKVGRIQKKNKNKKP